MRLGELIDFLRQAEGGEGALSLAGGGGTEKGPPQEAGGKAPQGEAAEKGPPQEAGGAGGTQSPPATFFSSSSYSIAKNKEIKALTSLAQAGPDELAYCENEKNAKDLPTTRAGAIITRAELAPLAPAGAVIMTSANPQLSFALLSALFARPLFSEEPAPARIHPSARILPGVYLGSGVEISAGVRVMPGAFIGDGVKIGEGSLIHPNATIYPHSRIGARCVLLAGCVIGSDGFGYAHTRAGKHIKIHHNGRVVLEDEVEVGAGTTIDRAVFGSTLIKKGTKIDNLVQIGHNCELGENCLIVSQTGLSGSSHLGRGVIMGGQSATSGHLQIGDHATIAARGGVSKSLAGGRIYGGFPIMLQRDWLRMWGKIMRGFRAGDRD